MTALLLALTVLPPYITPGTSDRVATVQLAGTPSGALVEVRAPDSRAWVVAGIVPGFVAIRLEVDGFYAFRYTAPGRAPAARMVHLRQGDQARIELNLAEDPDVPLFYGSWLAYIAGADIRAVRMTPEPGERAERVLVASADAARLDWLPDGRLLYQRAGDGALMLVDLSTGAAVATVPADPAFVLVQGHPDGRRAIGLSGDGRPAACYFETGEVARVGPDDTLSGWVALAPKGDRIAAMATPDGPVARIAVHDIESARLISHVAWERPLPPPGECVFVGSGDRLLLVPYLGPNSGRLRLMDLGSKLLWLGPDGLRGVRMAADSIHYAAQTTGPDPRIVFGMLGSNESIEVGRGTCPAWSPPPPP